MNIYTRTGDKGDTGFIGGRVSKASQMMQLLGDMDELNACMGMVVSAIPESDKLNNVREICVRVQNFIFQLGAVVADKQVSLPYSKVFGQQVTAEITYVESTIDELQAQLPELKNFILPGGSQVASQLHLARAVCRRAERSTVVYAGKLTNEYQLNVAECQKYLNRLADLLFVLARYANFREGLVDTIWKAPN